MKLFNLSALGLLASSASIFSSSVNAASAGVRGTVEPEPVQPHVRQVKVKGDEPTTTTPIQKEHDDFSSSLRRLNLFENRPEPETMDTVELPTPNGNGLVIHPEKLAATNLIVAFANQGAYNKIISHTSGQGKKPTVKNTYNFMKPRLLKNKDKQEQGARAEAASGAATIGFCVLEFEEGVDLAAEIHALRAIEGVTSVEEDGIMSILEDEEQFRGGGDGVVIRDVGAEAAAETSQSQHGRRHRHLQESTPYGIDMVNVTDLWAIEPNSNEKIKICVVDTGYDLVHEDLPNKADHDHDVQGKGFGSGLTNWNTDHHSHGTHCAGTIGAIGDNGLGVVGVNPDPSRFLFRIAKVSDDGSVISSALLQGLNYCVNDAGAKIVSISFGGGGFSSMAHAFFTELYDKNVLFIAPAGNSRTYSYSYPASYSSVMSVASVDSSGSHSAFSSQSSQVEIAGPGSDVLSTVPGNQYASYSGTSMATSHVAGVAALLWSHFPECNNNQIRNAMIQSTREPPNDETNTPGWDKYYGWGIVNAGFAYELLKKGCELAGGPSPAVGENLSDKALGGRDQKCAAVVCDDGLDYTIDTCDPSKPIVNGWDDLCVHTVNCVGIQQKSTCNKEATCVWEGSPQIGQCKFSVSGPTLSPAPTPQCVEEGPCSDSNVNCCNGCSGGKPSTRRCISPTIF